MNEKAKVPPSLADRTTPSSDKRNHIAHVAASQPDQVMQRKAIAEAFLKALDPAADQFTFQTFADAPIGNTGSCSRILHGTLDSLFQDLDRLNQRGAGVFFAVNETDFNGRRIENITRVRALWQEADEGGEPLLPVVPHIVVNTSPGKYHRYVLVEGAPLDEFPAVQQRLVDDYGSDRNAKDITRVLRVPGFYHQKDRSRPYLVTTVATSGAQPLAWGEAKRIFPPVVVHVASTATNVVPLQTKGNHLLKPAEIKSALLYINPDAPYSEWLKVGMALHSTGAGKEAFDFWDEWSRQGAKYEAGLTARKWESFNAEHKGGTTIRSLFALAFSGGWHGEIVPNSDIEPLVEMQRRRMLAYFSSRHAMALIEGRDAVVYRERDKSLGHWKTRFASARSVATLQKPNKIPFFNKAKQEITYEPLFNHWLEAPYRKSYRQVYFRPIPGLVAGDDTVPDAHALNLYQGLNFAPKAGNCDTILRHLWEVWANESTPAFQYAMGWLARMFQRPDERGHTVLALRSGEGTGKNIIVDILVRAFGAHAFVAAKSDELTGRFNSDLATSVLVFANEAVWGGNRQAEGALKTLITDEELTLEMKYLNRFRVRNCTHVIMASNSDWFAPVGIDDRRFFVLDVSDRYRGDRAYFKNLSDAIANGEDAAFIHHLLTRDISGFDPRAIPDLGPKHESKFIAKELTADSATQWWLECLDTREIWLKRELEQGELATTPRIVNLAQGWEDGEISILARDLREAYVQWAGKMRKRVKESRAFGKVLRGLIEDIERQRTGARTSRTWAYQIPHLGHCIAMAERRLGQKLFGDDE